VRNYLKFNQPELQTLINLGLTLVQARVYLTLVHYSPLNVASISKISTVARPDVYRTLDSLKQSGLVEEIVGIPTMFQAVPIDKIIPALLQKKTQEHDKLKMETEKLLVSHKQKEQNINYQTGNGKFILIPEKQAIVNRISKAIEEAQKNIDSIFSWKRFTQGINGVYGEVANKACKRGIEFRIIVENPPERVNFDLADFCQKNPQFKMKFVSNCPKTILEIYDATEVFIVIDPDTGITESALWSNNQSLVALTQDYFNILWLTARDKPT
jgi:sugar-specific transcriptional regulator TrmB